MISLKYFTLSMFRQEDGYFFICMKKRLLNFLNSGGEANWNGVIKFSLLKRGEI